MPKHRVGPNLITSKVSFPIFSLAWFHNPHDLNVVVAHGGGGGAAKTGVNNSIILKHYPLHYNGQCFVSLDIDTGDDICVGLALGLSPVARAVLLVAAIGTSIHVYDSYSGALLAVYVDKKKSDINCVSLAVDGARIVAGCEDGRVLSLMLESKVEQKKVRNKEGKEEIIDEKLVRISFVTECKGHEKAVSSVCFKPYEAARFISSGKDGTCREWDARNGKFLSGMKCELGDLGPKVRPQSQVLVRTCVYGSGDIVYTCASGRRGRSFLTKWARVGSPPGQQRQNSDVNAQNKQSVSSFIAIGVECVSENPCSAMALSGNGTLICLGSVDGHVIYINPRDLSVIKVLEEVHDLPITSIAAIPFIDGPARLRVPSSGFDVQAISASADNKIAMSSSQKKTRNYLKLYFYIFIIFIVLPITLGMMFVEKCWGQVNMSDLEVLQKCFMSTIIAPSSKQGILVVPY